MHQDHFLEAINEHKAAAYFMEKGYSVFWPAVQQSLHDFIIHNNDEGFKTVQVKTASWNRSGRNGYLQCRTRMKGGGPPKSDLFVVVHDNSVWVIPSSKIKSSNLSLMSTLGDKHYGWTSFKDKLCQPI